jgi:DNA-binding NarL/FixJ family response regulator
MLIIHAQVAVAVSLKQALERTGNYAVRPFTRADAALAYLAEHPQEVALIDLTLPDGVGLVGQVAHLQPGIRIIVTPRQSDADLAVLGARASVSPPLSARDLIPVIHRTMEGERRVGTTVLNAPVPDAPEAGGAGRTDTRHADTRQLPAEPAEPKAQTRASQRRAPEGLPEYVPLDRVLGAKGGAGSVQRALDEPPPEGSTPSMPMLASQPEPPLPAFTGPLPTFTDPPERETGRIDTDILFADLDLDAYRADADRAASGGYTTFDDPDDFSDVQALMPTFQPAYTPAPPEEPADPFASLIASMRGTGALQDAAARTALMNRIQQIDPPPEDSAFDQITLTDMMASVGDEGSAGYDTGFEQVLATLRTDPIAATAPHTPYHDPEADGDGVPPMGDRARPVTRARTAGEPPTLPVAAQPLTGVAARPLTGDASLMDDAARPLTRDASLTDDAARPLTRDASLTDDPAQPLMDDAGQPPTDDAARPPSAADVSADVEALFADLDRSIASGILSGRSAQAGDNTARFILEQAEEDTPLDSFSISGLIASIEAQLPAHRPTIRPLPSWEREAARRRALGLPDTGPQLPSGTGVFPPTLPVASLTGDAASGSSPFTFDDAPLMLPDARQPLTKDASLTGDARQPLTGDTAPDDAPRSNDAARSNDAPRSNDAARADEDAAAFDLTTMASPAQRARLEAQPADPDTLWLPGLREDDTTGDTAPDSSAAVPDDERDAGETGSRLQVWRWVATDEPPTLPRPDVLGAVDTSPDAKAFPSLEDDASAWFGDAAYETLAVAPAAPEADSAPPAPDDDPYIMALSAGLMDAALELTADAVILTRENTIVAVAGRMVEAEIEELRAVVHDSWDAEPDEVRVRFHTVPQSGQNYCLYGRRTVDDMTLTLVLGGEVNMSSLRRQTARVLDALASIPEPAVSADAGLAEGTAAPEPAVRPAADAYSPVFGEPARAEAAEAAAPAPAAEAVRTAYAYVWSTEPGAAIEPGVAQAIAAGLRVQLGEQAWDVYDLQVGDAFVYLYAEVPGETPPYEVVRDLKRRAGQIARETAVRDRRGAAGLRWSDGYLIVAPGRPLDDDEIQQFMAFEQL